MLHVLTIFPQSSLEGIAALFKTSDCNYWSHLQGGGGDVCVCVVGGGTYLTAAGPT